MVIARGKLNNNTSEPNYPCSSILQKMVNAIFKTKKRIDNQSGTRIGSNDDLLTEILVRLPVTSVLRFKLVSKQWRLLLSHEHFTHRYDINNLFKSPGLFAGNMYVPFDVEHRRAPRFRSLGFYFSRSNVEIMHSCNGLLLCFTVHYGACEYIVFNPTTKQLAIIPSVPKNIRTMALAYHQIECVHYKVVCVHALETSEGLLQIQVYSSDTRKWKICIESLSAQISKFRYPVYWNGGVHWAPDYLDSNHLYFNLDVEQLQTLPVPEGLVSDEISTMYFGESRGHLHLIFPKDNGNYVLRLNVYEMLRDHSGWFVKYQLQLDELPGAFPEMLLQYELLDFYLEVVDVVRGEEEEDTFLVLLTPLKMIKYNVHDKSFKKLCSYNIVEDRSFHRYIETLSSF